MFRNISNGFCATESREVSLKGNVCEILVDPNAIDKPDILNFYKYLKSDSQPPKNVLFASMKAF